MKNVITSVMPDSIAEEVGIEENDILLSVNGEKIVDIIDYRFLTNDEEIVLEIQKPNGEIWDYEIEKDYGYINYCSPIQRGGVATETVRMDSARDARARVQV